MIKMWFSIQVLVNSKFLIVIKSFSYAFKAQIACYELKGDLRPLMLKEIFYDSLKISKFTRIWKTIQAWLGVKSCFSHTNPSNFRRPLQSLLLRYTAENWQVT